MSNDHGIRSLQLQDLGLMVAEAVQKANILDRVYCDVGPHIGQYRYKLTMYLTPTQVEVIEGLRDGQQAKEKAPEG